MAVTIRDLSNKCGLSVSTVSKALNGYSDISETTRRLVAEAAHELGYFPNAHARALKTKRSYNLGVLFSDDQNSGLTHSFFSAVLESFKKAAESRGYDITFISHNIGEKSMTYLEHCIYREVDGVCIANIDFSSIEAHKLIDSSIPVVTIDHLFNGRTCIQSDNLAGMKQLVSYIGQIGHRKIGYIHGRQSSVTNVRLGAFYRTMEELGLGVREDWMGECVYNDPASVRSEARRILGMEDRPTCLLTSDDYAMLGALSAAGDLGLRVPEDVSIAGYDGIAVAQLMKPRFTTVRQDTDRMGTMAASKLIELIETPKTAIPEMVVIPCELIVGETVAALA